MNYREITEGLDAMTPEAKSYVKRALNYYHDQRYTRVNSLYLDVLEEHMGWVESLHHLKLLDDDDWATVYEHAEGEK
tara:strand:+ start:403 stop:633 length:231 start_codon:yes stop_codon:yes gene_type:complete